MEVERVSDPFTGGEKYYLILSEEELRLLRFDMSIALVHMKTLDAINNFLYDTDNI